MNFHLRFQQWFEDLKNHEYLVIEYFSGFTVIFCFVYLFSFVSIYSNDGPGTFLGDNSVQTLLSKPGQGNRCLKPDIYTIG